MCRPARLKVGADVRTGDINWVRHSATARITLRKATTRAQGLLPEFATCTNWPSVTAGSIR